MDSLTSNLPLFVFLLTGAMAIASAILVVTMRNPVHSALFLLVTFLSVAILFVIKAAEFVAAVQILVYAGGVMVLFLFVVMLINYRQLPKEKVLSKVWIGGIAVGVAILLLIASLARTGGFHPVVPGAEEKLATVVETQVVTGADGQQTTQDVAVGNSNSEAVAMALFREYLVPFEVVSLFLLVAMIGAIVIGKRELSATEEEATPDFILERSETEKKVKEAVGV